MKKRAIAILLAGIMAGAGLAGCGQAGTASEENNAESSAQQDAAATEAPAKTTPEATEDASASSAAAGSSDASGSDADEITGMDKDSLKGTTITFWHAMGGVTGDALTTLVDKFNNENEYGITVNAVYQGSYDDEINKLRAAQIGNMGCDLAQIYDIGTRFMIDSGWVVPMQDLIDADGYDISQIEPNIAAYYTVDDKLYSMPFNSSTPILYYNKDMFDKAGLDKAPSTFAEIETAGDKLAAAGCEETISLAVYGWFFEELVGKQGVPYVNNGNGRDSYATEVSFNENDGALNILKAWKELQTKGYAPNVSQDDYLTAFTSGKAAMVISSTATLKQILQDVGGKFEVGTAYYPAAVDGATGSVSNSGASLWALNNGDEKKQAATWQFIKFLVSPESQAYWSVQTGYFPVTVKAQDEQVFKDNVAEYPQFQTALDQLHDSSPKDTGALLSVFPEARKIVEQEIENMLNDQETPEEAAGSMTDQINSSITEYNQLNY